MCSFVRAALTSVALTALVACAKGDTNADSAAASSTAAATAGGTSAAAAPAASPIEGMKGKWAMRSVPVQGDTTPTVYTIDASGDTTSWTLTFAGRATPVKLHVISVSGDSVVTQTDEYDSARRKGQRVVTTTTLRPMGDRVTGTSTARYKVTGPDSVLQLRSEGTRMP